MPEETIPPTPPAEPLAEDPAVHPFIGITDDAGKCVTVDRREIAALEALDATHCAIHLRGGSTINLTSIYAEASAELKLGI